MSLPVNTLAAILTASGGLSPVVLIAPDNANKNNQKRMLRDGSWETFVSPSSSPLDVVVRVGSHWVTRAGAAAYTSADGRTFTTATGGVPAASLGYVFDAAHAGSNLALTGHQGSGTAWSTDGGYTWSSSHYPRALSDYYYGAMVIAGNLLIIGMGGPSNIIAWTDLTAPDTDGAWPSVAITGIPMSLSYRGGVVYLMCYSSGSVLTYTSPDLGQTWTPVTNDLPTTASASERFVWSVALGGKWAYSAYSGIVYVSTDFAAWSALGDLGLTGGAAHLEDYNSELYIGNDTGGLVKWGGAAFVLAEAMGQSVQFGAKP